MPPSKIVETMSWGIACMRSRSFSLFRAPALPAQVCGEAGRARAVRPAPPVGRGAKPPSELLPGVPRPERNPLAPLGGELFGPHGHHATALPLQHVVLHAG